MKNKKISSIQSAIKSSSLNIYYKKQIMKEDKEEDDQINDNERYFANPT